MSHRDRHQGTATKGTCTILPADSAGGEFVGKPLHVNRALRVQPMTAASCVQFWPCSAFQCKVSSCATDHGSSGKRTTPVAAGWMMKFPADDV